jgi:UDP-N-acetylmuramoyl-L-alanyl-D-glutamate--2,6-diaminopimelate ligase
MNGTSTELGAAARATEISGLSSDSRLVRPGFLFAALPGSDRDGRDFIGEAIGLGAAAVLAAPGASLPGGAATLLTDANPRRRFALMAARFYAAQPEWIAAVTGTNGKTSTVSFLRQIWTALGMKAASLGTLGLGTMGLGTMGLGTLGLGAMGLASAAADAPSPLTTPDPVALHQILAGLCRDGVDHLALEASSHGLDQHRLDGVRVKAAAFTMLGRDHLDYHADNESYLAAKLRLFSEILEPGGVAVVNPESPAAEKVINAAAGRGCRVFSFGAQGDDVRLKDLQHTATGQRLDIVINDRDFTVTLPLIGDFQAANALCALALAIALGAVTEQAVAALGKLEGVPGRLQHVGDVSGAAVYVDYAHTPDALSAVLSALRHHVHGVQGRLHLVFGCGGDRDRGKRPEMGRLAASLADAVIVTDDNPRGEDAAQIRAAVVKACPGAREIPDRHEAIHRSVAALAPGDVLLVAGKGHEQGQIVGGEIHPFSDAEVIRDAIPAAEKEGGE